MDQEETDFPSHSLQNSFISTLDHLPCDIVRSLWLIQSCNLKIEKSKQEINDILSRLERTSTGQSSSLVRIYELKRLIRHLSNESIQETRAMNNQLITHKLNLLQEMEQLNKIEVFKNNNDHIDESQRKELREQLKKHYLENPLASQVEAVEEQKKENETMKEATKEGEYKPSGLKMILKIPIQDKVTRPTDKKVVKKIDKKPKKPEIKKVVIKKPKVEKEPEIVTISEEDEEVDEDNKLYCFCNQKSFGNMISCDNEESCRNGEWFHYKCVGLLNRVDALKYTTGKMKWYCSDTCREMAEAKSQQIQEKKRKKRKRRW
ncbi:PHD finger protein ING2 [Candida viswanathii]|uniref:PHD finger protein ING2 n=1 Tax=Candida viswanathii TaxID=5486 RepID=A0A367XPD9_9ASCO|nr:PHD finger protein ING2 [Candida viswanathii]